MSARTAYIEKMDESLENIDQKIRVYARKAQELSGEVKDRGKEKLTDLERKRGDFRTKLNSVRSGSIEAWDEVQKGLDRAKREMDEAASEAKKVFQEYQRH